MKHKMKSDGHFSARCEHPGCIASIQGPIQDWSQEDLDQHFSGDCPYVFNKKKSHMDHDESVNHLLERADEEIESWKNVKKFWTKPIDSTKGE